VSTLRVNLLPQRRIIASRRAHAMRRWARGLSMYVATLAIIGYGIDRAIGSSSTSSSDLATAQHNLDKASAEISAISKQLQQQRARLNAAHEVGRHPDWSILLAYLARDGDVLAPLQVSSVELGTSVRESAASAGAGTTTSEAATKGTQRVSTLRVTGNVRAAQDALAFATLLQESGVFTKVNTESIGGGGAGDAGDGRTGFVIACELVEPQRGGNQIATAAAGGTGGGGGVLP
jgi:Tfp pilus assembly protein PilN